MLISITKPFRATWLIGLGWALAVTTACKSTTEPGEPTLLEFVSGQNQSGAVGNPLPIKVAIKASNSHGPVANITIAVSTEAQGGGSVAPSHPTTDASGIAQVTWTLGTKVGVQVLTAITLGSAPVNSTLQATANSAQATVVQATSEVFQLVVVGHAVPALPVVKVTDAFGNGISGVTVIFNALQGNSVLTGTSRVSDAGGLASLDSWTIGQDALSYTIQARIQSGASAIFEARGIPAFAVLVAGTDQTVNVGTAVTVAPAVKATRDDGSPLPNVPVTFTVTDGGGTVTGSSVLTGVDGIARVGQWTVGGVPGLNHLTAQVLGRPTIVFAATGRAAVAAVVTSATPTPLAGIFGNYLAGAPTVTVNDADGHPIALATVNFQVTQGGGSIVGLTRQTDALGRAALLSWRLGAAGVQEVTATVAGLPPVTFAATGSAAPAPTFRIEVRYDLTCSGCTNPSASQRTAFDLAAARWTSLILTGGAPYPIKPSEVDPSCGSLSGTVDGVIIIAGLGPIDGPNGILGQSGPCVLRDDGFLPVTGIMRFDTADLAVLESGGQLNPVILHEMAHVLGFGTIWNFNIPGTAGYDPLFGTNAFLKGANSGDPTFAGLGSRAAFFGSVAAGTTFTGAAVPVEACCGPGTAFSHWRETIFRSELMTGFIESANTPLSALTVQQFRDLGYVVNDAGADAYNFQAALQTPSGDPQLGSTGTASIQLMEAPIPGPMLVINRQGHVVARVARNYR